MYHDKHYEELLTHINSIQSNLDSIFIYLDENYVEKKKIRNASSFIKKVSEDTQALKEYVCDT